MNARVPGAARVLMRSAATAPSASALTVILVAVLAFLSVFAPAAVAQARTDTVRAAVATSDPLTRDPSGSVPGLPVAGAGDAAWQPAQAQAAMGIRGSGAILQRVLTEPRLVSTLAPVALEPQPARATPKNVTSIAATPVLDAMIEYTEGRAPAADAGGALQVAASEETAQALDWPIGEVRVGAFKSGLGAQVVLTGVFRARDTTDSDWAHLPRALQPSYELSGSGEKILLPAVFGAAAALPDMTQHTDVATTSVWFGLTADAVDAASAPEVAAALRRLSSTPVAFDVSTTAFWNAGVELRTTAPRLLDDGLSRADAMVSVLAVIAIGPLVVAFVVAGLAGRVLAERRAPYLRLMRARGASPGATAGVLALNGLVLGALGAGVGILAALVAAAVLGLPALALGLLVAGLFALVPAAVVPIATAARLAAVGRADLGAPEPTRARTRLLVEAAVLLAAGAITVLLVVRSGSVTSVDPMLVALPAVLAAAVTVLVLRLLPLLLAAAERRGRSSAGLVPLLGPARARRDSAIRAAAVLSIVIGLGIAMFAVSFAATVSAGISAVAQSVTGADLKITGAYLTGDRLESVAKVPGVAASAGLRDSASVAASGPRGDASAFVYSVDAASLADVQRDFGSARLPLDGLEATSKAVPVVISQSLAQELGAKGISANGHELRVLGVVPDENPFGSATRWMVVDASRSSALMRVSYGAQGVFVRVADGADAHDVAAGVAGIVGDGAITAIAADVERRNAADPAFAAVRVASLAAVGVVAVLLAAGVAMTLVLGGSSRRRAFAVIRALGNPRRDEFALVAWEVTPALLLAVPFGAAVGVALSWLMVRALDLRAFVGGVAQPELQFGGWWQVAVVSGCVLIATAAVVVAALVATRAEAAEAARDAGRA